LTVLFYTVITVYDDNAEVQAVVGGIELVLLMHPDVDHLGRASWFMHFCRLACRTSSAPAWLFLYFLAFPGLGLILASLIDSGSWLRVFASTANGRVKKQRHQRLFPNLAIKSLLGTIARAACCISIKVCDFLSGSFQGLLRVQSYCTLGTDWGKLSTGGISGFYIA